MAVAGQSEISFRSRLFKKKLKVKNVKTFLRLWLHVCSTYVITPVMLA